MEYVQRTEEELRDYYFMRREIERLKSYLQDAGEGTVGSYEVNADIV
jgi:tRNA(Arg) A34 adenosine deaminase TadA